jgi:hypothetical protein
MRLSITTKRKSWFSGFGPDGGLANAEQSGLETYRDLILMMFSPYDEESRARKQNPRTQIAWRQFCELPHSMDCPVTPHPPS